MDIMTAGMHVAVDRGKVQTCHFLHRQRIHIGAQEHGLAAIAHRGHRSF